jgi:hypothetical protein
MHGLAALFFRLFFWILAVPAWWMNNAALRLTAGAIRCRDAAARHETLSRGDAAPPPDFPSFADLEDAAWRRDER